MIERVFVGGAAVVVPGGKTTPTSKNICSRPAGATEISIRASLLLSFLKECGVPTGMLAKVPALAMSRWSSFAKPVARRAPIMSHLFLPRSDSGATPLLRMRRLKV